MVIVILVSSGWFAAGCVVGWIVACWVYGLPLNPFKLNQGRVRG
jgi:hypothetical protein